LRFLRYRRRGRYGVARTPMRAERRGDAAAYECLRKEIADLLRRLIRYRTGAAARPGIAGALAGLLSGALGAAAYTLGCTNDVGLLVAFWYSAAILIMTGLGTAIGRRVLAW
jgi:hypothetical protein